MSGLFISLAVMLSSMGLSAAGDGVWQGGAAFMIALAVVAVFSIFSARKMEAFAEGKVKATPADGFIFGFLDSARIFTLIVMAASWLAASGSVFNEVFWHWLPAGWASFILLALIFIACLIADENGADVFTICLTLGFCALVYVPVMAIQPAESLAGYPTDIPNYISMSLPNGALSGGLGYWFNLLFLAAFAFIGFDLPLAFKNKSSRVIPAVLLALIAYVVLGWAISLIGVPESLSEDVPLYMYIAGAGLGKLGTALMGGAVVLITVSGVLGLFMVTGKRMESVLSEDYKSLSTKGAAAILFVVLCVLLYSGWIATETLDSFILAGLCFWFSSYALVDLLFLIGSRRKGGGVFSLIRSLPSLLIHGGAAVYCLLETDKPSLFYSALGVMVVAGILLGIGHYSKVKELVLAQEPEVEEGLEDETDIEEAVPDTDDEELKIVDYN
jgi:hypothetical protein